MKNETPFILWLIIIGIAIISFGSVWHNMYKTTKMDPIIGFVAPVNESVWEHTKLIMYPVLLVWVLSILLFMKTLNNIFLALLLSTVVGVFAMILINFFIEMFIHPKNFGDMMTGHMANYIISVVLSLGVLFYVFKLPSKSINVEFVSLALYILLISLTSFWSYSPPSKNGIWYSQY